MFFQQNERPPPPSIDRQKEFIVENADNLDINTKKAILRVVMLEVGETGEVTDTESASGKRVVPVVLENKASQEVSISLNNIENAEVILHIYNIVYNRRAALNEPARRLNF